MWFRICSIYRRVYDFSEQRCITNGHVSDPFFSIEWSNRTLIYCCAFWFFFLFVCLVCFFISLPYSREKYHNPTKIGGRIIHIGCCKKQTQYFLKEYNKANDYNVVQTYLYLRFDKICRGFPHSDTGNIETKCLKFGGMQRG